MATDVTTPPSGSSTPESDGVQPGGPDRSRLTQRRWFAWTTASGVALLSLLLRLYHLGQPNQFAFDETYYAKDGWSLVNFGYVRNYPEQIDGVDVNDAILDGQTTGVWSEDPSLIVHPEVGKWLIGLGEKAFGMDPFGWRIAAVLVGSLMVLVMCRLLLRLTGSLTLSLVGGLLLSLDGLHFVLSRLALLDIFLAFFMLCGVSCVVNDRFWMRARIGALPGGEWGPVRGLLWRPWLLAGGISFGLAVGTKWTALFPLAAFGLLTWLWSAGARREVGVRFAVVRSAVVDGIPAFGYLVLVGFVVYVATWTGWLANAGDYEQDLSATQYTRFSAEGPCVDGEPENELNDNRWATATEPDASGVGEISQSLRSLAYYHRDLYNFHAHFLNCSTHNYESNPWGWLVLNRPVGVSADTGIEPGTRGCGAPAGSDCIKQVLLIGNPMIWWAGVLALLYALARWLGAKDWRFGLAVVGAGSTWLPWLAYADRPIFLFYAVAILPFVVIALTLTLGRIIGPDRVPTTRRTVGVIVAGSFFVLVLLNFAWFWPIWTNELLTKSEWLDRIWFERWI